jgi:hypothetical protein
MKELYSDKILLKEKIGGPFNHVIEYDPTSKIIDIKCTNSINSIKIEYEIYLKSQVEKFDKEKFTLFDTDNYEYLKSILKIGINTLDITKKHFENLDSRNLYPSGVWNGSLDGTSLKYYKIAGREILLICGLDMECNGSDCTGYQMYIVQIINDKISFHALLFPGNYPYYFENTFLFENENDNNPAIYVPKLDVSDLKGIEDFDIFSIDFNSLKKLN